MDSRNRPAGRTLEIVGQDLGTHGYYYSPWEKDGIAYTCRGGHIDIAHLRIATDWTAYPATRTYRHLMKHDSVFSYKLAVDRSRDYVQFSYPPDWDSLSEAQRSRIAQEMALAVGPYLAYKMTTWHEILTWFGFKCVGLPTEFPSAFSWEDSFSNLLGTVIAVRALQDREHSYEEAVKIALDEEMAKLGIQPASVSNQASESVKGTWSTGDFTMLLTIMKRNFDIGLGNGMVTPSLIPNLPECPGAEPLSYPAPSLEVLARYGFSLTLEIAPHEWESGKILTVAYGSGKPGKRIDPEQHFPILMDYIRKAATALYPEFDYVTYEDGGPPRTNLAK
ncbi:MAG: DUF4056 domain-containing protein [Phycisphaerae bacterium]|nr:DUF4056 domain-containing protein [Phycisphaerae bacterium]